MNTSEKCFVEFIDRFHQYVKDGLILKDECIKIIESGEKLTMRFKILHPEGMHGKKFVAIRNEAVRVCSRGAEPTRWFLERHPGYIGETKMQFIHQDGSAHVTTALLFEFDKIQDDFNKIIQ